MAYKKVVEPVRSRDNTPIEKPTICIRKSERIDGKLLFSNGIYFTFKAVDELSLTAGMLFAVEVDEKVKKIRLKRMKKAVSPDLKCIRLNRHGIDHSPAGRVRLYAVMGSLFKTLKVATNRTIRKELQIINKNEFIFSYDTKG